LDTKLKTQTQPIFFEDSTLKETLPLTLAEKRERLCYLLFKNAHDLMQYLSSVATKKKGISRYFNIEGWSKVVIKQKCFKYEMEKSILPNQIIGQSS
jgi:hypothetical protein